MRRAPAERSSVMAGRWLVAAFLSILLGGCYSTESAVFGDQEGVRPPLLEETYVRRDADPSLDNKLPRYLRVIPLPGTNPLYVVEDITPVPPETTGGDLRYNLARLVPVAVEGSDGWHIAEFAVRTAPYRRREYQVVRILAGALDPLDVGSERLAGAAAGIGARYGLQVGSGPGPIQGETTPQALRGFFAGLIRAAPAATQAAFVTGPIPRPVADEYHARLLDAWEPGRRTRKDLGPTFVQYVAALDARGLPWGTYALARHHLAGNRHDEARRLAQIAIAAGVPRANYVLARLHTLAGGADVRAAGFYRLAAEAGESRAMFALFRGHRDAVGVPLDMAMALSWLRRGADAGLADARLELGRRLAEGEGVPRDDAAAYSLFVAVANTGDAEGIDRVAWAMAAGRGVAANPAQATRHYGEAAQLGLPHAQWQYGERILVGTGVRQDRSIALGWIRLAANNGVFGAKETLRREGAEVVRCHEHDLYNCATAPDGRRLISPGATPWFFLDGREAPREVWPQ